MSRWAVGYRTLLIGGLIVVGGGFAWWEWVAAEQTPAITAAAPIVGPVPRRDCDVSLFLAGDAIINQPWSAVPDPAFLRLVGAMRDADVAIANLETLIHEFNGFAQADAGGTYMASPPGIADELAWAGIDMLSHANNHTFDYGAIGVLETHEHSAKAGLVLAGSGADLQAARSPAYLRVGDKTIALVSAASTFVPYGRAGRSRPDMRGRPGLNPLATTSRSIINVTPSTVQRFGQVSRLLRLGQGNRFRNEAFDLFGFRFEVADAHGLKLGERAVESDLAANLASVREAAAQADIVVMALHYHHEMQAWMTAFARQAIDAGANAVVVHGPHRMHGVEVYGDSPIFYGMGNFVRHNELVAPLPADFYEEFGLGDEATPAEATTLRSTQIGYTTGRWAWEAYGSTLCFSDDRVTEVRLLPMDLGFGEALPLRGRPRYAGDELGRTIIDQVQQLSAEFGTSIGYSAPDNAGFVAMESGIDG